ncbi:MAG: hypothetical protein ACRDJE_00720 [Dehalococcoidia bacterium]
MTEGQTSESMTPDEIQTFATKLEAWGESLTRKERVFLLEILGRAASTEDVAGHMPIFMKYDGIDGDVTLTSDAYVKIDFVLAALSRIGSVDAQWNVRDASKG